MLWDMHMHTHFSGDSEATPEDMIAAARKAGLAGICFTDHLDLDYPKEPELFWMDPDSYFHELTPLTGEDVHIGIELGLQPHLSRELRMITENYPFDFVIGSSHVARGMDPYYPEFFEGRSVEEACVEYFTSILVNIAAFDDFDVYGHLDYVMRYASQRDNFYSYEKYADVINLVLRALIEKGKGIEINTSGFRYGLGHPMPTEDILARYRQLGGEIITIGSDAHAPEDIAYAFAKVPEILKDAGFRYFTVFEKRKPLFMKLP